MQFGQTLIIFMLLIALCRYGDKVPAGVCSRLFAVTWIVTGLVMASLLIGVMASSLTFQTIDKEIMLYGTEVC